MTTKGKRSGALRKIEYQEASSYRMGGWVDDTFPVNAVHDALQGVAGRIDLAAFDDSFGQRLGRYRSMVESQRTRPSVADETILVEEAMEGVRQLQMRLEFLPPAANAHINCICWNRRRELFHEFRARLDADLKEALSLLVLTERELDSHKGAAGRKQASQRDWLLHDVAHDLESYGLGKMEAAETASKVLRAAGIDSPEGPSEARKLIREMEHAMGEK